MPFYEQMHYKTYGDPSAPAALFLHGFLGNCDSWNGIINGLKKSFFCIALDLPGHGQTIPDVDEQYSISACAKQIVQFLAYKSINATHLIGYSMGGRLALFLVLNYPQLINKLALESASPGLRTEPERLERIRSDENLAKKLETVPLDEFLNDWYNQPLFDSIRRNSQRFNKLLNQLKKNDPAALAKSLRFIGTGSQPSLWDELANLNSPSLLIVGAEDSRFYSIAGEMSAKSEMFDIVVIEGCGHNVHLEKPEEYTKELFEFFS